MSFSTENHPGVCAEPAAATSGFVFNHSMLRVKDPAVALDFYTRVLGLRALRKLDFPEMKFSLYFLAHVSAADAVPEDPGERTSWTVGNRHPNTVTKLRIRRRRRSVIHGASA